MMFSANSTTSLTTSTIFRNFSEQCETDVNFSSISILKQINTAYAALTVICASLSIVGCLLIVYFYVTISALRTPSRKLLVYLSLCDLVIAIGNIMGVGWQQNFVQYPLNDSLLKDPGSLCRFQAMISAAASMASFIWTMSIALNGYLIIIRDNKALTKRYSWVPHLFAWGIPVVTTVIVASYHRFGFNYCEPNWWCWVKREADDSTSMFILWELLAGKFWEITAYLFVVIVYGRIILELKRYIKRMEKHRIGAGYSSNQIENSPASRAYATANRKLIFVPLVFICARIWGTLRILSPISETTTIAATYIGPVQGAGDSCQGFVNCLMWIWLTPELRQKFFSRIKCCRQSTAVTEENTLDSSSPLIVSDDTSGLSRTMEYGSLHTSIGQIGEQRLEASSGSGDV